VEDFSRTCVVTGAVDGWSTRYVIHVKCKISTVVVCAYKKARYVEYVFFSFIVAHKSLHLKKL